MFVATYDSEYDLVCLSGKSIKIEEIQREKMSPEYALIAVSPTGQKEIIAKFEHIEYCKNLIIEISQKMQNAHYNPSYVRRFNGNPNKTIWG